MKKIVLYIAAFALLAFAGQALAQPIPPPGADVNTVYKRVLKGLQQLKLTTDQKKKVKESLEKYHPQISPLVRSLFDERRTLRGLIRDEKFDEKAIRDQVAKIAGVEADIAVFRAKVSQELRASLTPEQQEKLKKIKVRADKRFERFAEGIGFYMMEE